MDLFIDCRIFEMQIFLPSDIYLSTLIKTDMYTCQNCPLVRVNIFKNYFYIQDCIACTVYHSLRDYMHKNE